MFFWLLACGPKAPPADWTDVSEQLAVAGTEAELPLGEGRPFEAEPESEAERAFAQAELAVASMHAGGPTVLGQVEVVQALCALASEDPALEAAAAARLGDAARLAWDAVLLADAPPLPDDLAAAADHERGELRAVYYALALEAYQQARAGTAPGDPWHAHALWGLRQLRGGGTR